MLKRIHHQRNLTWHFQDLMGRKRTQYLYWAENKCGNKNCRYHILLKWRLHHKRAKWHYEHMPKVTSPVALGRLLAAQRGWIGAEWSALYTLWNHESGWNPSSVNSQTGACGIPQFYPCRDFRDTHAQIVDGLDYIHGRYHDPITALAFWNANGWY